jgi:S1-C subfamily serine protease
VEGALTGRRLERPWLGARLAPVTRELADELQLGRVAGAVVTRLQDKSPAAEAGLQAGDVIVAVDGHDVDDTRAVHYPQGPADQDRDGSQGGAVRPGRRSDRRSPLRRRARG